MSKKLILTVTIDTTLYKWIEHNRGKTPRSLYVNNLLLYCKRNKHG